MNCIVVSISDGFRRGLWAVAGIVLAAACHMTASLLGLSAVLMAHAGLFHLIKWLGVAYLAWLGMTMFLKRTLRVCPPTLPLRWIIISMVCRNAGYEISFSDF